MQEQTHAKEQHYKYQEADDQHASNDIKEEIGHPTSLPLLFPVFNKSFFFSSQHTTSITGFKFSFHIKHALAGDVYPVPRIFTPEFAAPGRELLCMQRIFCQLLRPIRYKLRVRRTCNRVFIDTGRGCKKT